MERSFVLRDADRITTESDLLPLRTFPVVNTKQQKSEEIYCRHGRNPLVPPHPSELSPSGDPPDSRRITEIFIEIYNSLN